MEQVRPGEQTPPSGGGAMSKAASAKDRVDSALSRLETMVEERLRPNPAAPTTWPSVSTGSNASTTN